MNKHSELQRRVRPEVCSVRPQARAQVPLHVMGKAGSGVSVGPLAGQGARSLGDSRGLIKGFFTRR